MAGKYDKYFINEPVVDGEFAPRIRFLAGDYFEDKEISVIWNCITQPFLMVEEAHSHDFDEFQFFYGGDSRNIKDFGAEVEMTIEGEKHLITSTTVLHIPKGLTHCPLNFKRVDKPIIFMNVVLTAQFLKPGTHH